MDNAEKKELCLSLLHADSEQEVIDLLEEAGFWSNSVAWRLLGDVSNNWSTVGAQQSNSVAAICEKLINGVDAVLMSECAAAGLPASGTGAPTDMRYAVAQLVEKNPNPQKEMSGRPEHWGENLRKQVAERITFAATGEKSSPCYTIVDNGEGQTPDRIPDTFMSLGKSNKLKIPFVQGKFNMGGTGVIRYCGQRGIQLIVTRRNPALLGPNASEEGSLWSFSVIRRDEPGKDERSSVIRYLAPIGSESQPGHGGVLSFAADSIPARPDANKPYKNPLEFGSIVKMFNYHAKGFSSNILMRDGLLRRVEVLLPQPALPMRFHECRNYKGHAGSFANNMVGVVTRLMDGSDNLETPKPLSAVIGVEGHSITVTIFVFKKNRAKTYRRPSDGIVFTVNGQTHATHSSSFFRTRAKLGYIAESMLVLVDCNHLTRRANEDLFMNSRDRLNDDSPLKNTVLSLLATELRDNKKLREIQNRRRQEAIAESLDDSKPLADALDKIIKKSPALSSMFKSGAKLTHQFKSKQVQEDEEEFQGQPHPTFFRFKKLKTGETLTRDCHINMRCRVQFETDVTDDYFSRPEHPGALAVTLEKNNTSIPVDAIYNPYSGTVNVTFKLPDNCTEGDVLNYRFELSDDTLSKPFINQLIVTVKSKVTVTSGSSKEKKKGGSKNKGKGSTAPQGLALPNISLVKQDKWDEHDPPFNDETAVRIIVNEDAVEENLPDSVPSYDFFINEHNKYALSEFKQDASSMDARKAQYVFGMTLLGLALVHDHHTRKKQETGHKSDATSSDDSEEGPERLVERMTAALSPFLLPMVDSLGTIDPSMLETLDIDPDNEGEADADDGEAEAA